MKLEVNSKHTQTLPLILLCVNTTKGDKYEDKKGIRK